MNNTNAHTKYLLPLLVVMSLIFFWNLSRNINNVLISHLKRACKLTDFQSSLIQLAFLGAYFLMALPAELSSREQADPILRINQVIYFSSNCLRI